MKKSCATVSLKSNPNPDPIAVKTLKSALSHALERAAFQLGKPVASLRVLLAFSGGCDSTTLAALAASLLPASSLTAVYVHHGLSPHASEWSDFCSGFCESRGIAFFEERVHVDKTTGSIEGAAREVRYKALNRRGASEKCDLILTAHHLDDQLETFLIHWMRGTGIKGLAGMPEIKIDVPIPIVRPFLHATRKEIEAAASSLGLSWIEDESNQDTAYLRNALRHKILPVLDEIRPGWKKAAASTIDNLREGAELLEERIQEALASVEEEKGLLTEGFRRLGKNLQNEVLKAFCQSRGLAGFSRSQWEEAVRQINEVEALKGAILQKNGLELRSAGTFLTVAKKFSGRPEDAILLWRGEEEITVAGFGGKLVFKEEPFGLPEAFLRSNPLRITLDKAGVKFRIQKSRPRKPLKQLYQENEIPDFKRRQLPLIYAGDTLIYAAGIGVSADVEKNADRRRFSLCWIPES